MNINNIERISTSNEEPIDIQQQDATLMTPNSSDRSNYY